VPGVHLLAGADGRCLAAKTPTPPKSRPLECRSPKRSGSPTLAGTSLVPWTTCEHPPPTRADCSICDRTVTAPTLSARRLRTMARARQNQHQQPTPRCHANRGRSNPLLLLTRRRHSEAGAAARAEAVVERPGRARLDVTDRSRTSRPLDRQSRASTVTFMRRQRPYRRSSRSRSRRCCSARAKRSSHRCRDKRCSNSVVQLGSAAGRAQLACNTRQCGSPHWPPQLSRAGSLRGPMPHSSGTSIQPW
jgi:hypothetical protein